ncbi:Vacuolar import and degradation protein 27 [Batrachochytrium dendrobatidis]
MFLLKSLGNIVFGENESSLIELKSGQLFYLDPSSTKSSRLLIFRDASLSVRRTTTKFNYQLVVTRIYEEGEAELDAADQDDLDDEHSFLLDSLLQFRLVSKGTTAAVSGKPKKAAQNSTSTSGLPPGLIWADPDDETGTCGWEFVPDATQVNDVSCKLLEEIAYTCMFERAMNKPKSQSTEQELQDYVADVKKLAEESSIGVWKAPLKTPVKKSVLAGAHLRNTESTFSPQPMSTGPSSPATPSPAMIVKAESDKNSVKAADDKNPFLSTLPQIPAVEIPVGKTLAVVRTDLYLYSVSDLQFELASSNVTASIVETGAYEFQLVVTVNNQPYIVQAINASMNPIFNNEHLSFVWVWLDLTTGTPLISWSLKFEPNNAQDLNHFMQIFSQCMNETSHKRDFSKLTESDQKYITRAFQEDVEMTDARDDEREAEAAEEDLLEEGEDEEEDNPNSCARFESADTSTQSKNSLLAVGYKHDRSFVVRGNRIGVFKHTDDQGLEFSTTINNVGTMDGTLFSPRRVMLHEQESSMLLMNPDDKRKIFRMDLERGKVIEEWKVDDDMDVNEIIPDKKYAQLTQEKTVIGINSNAIFRIDPRLAGNKRVEAQSNVYKTSNQFSVASTTGNGELAVASDKGDIRLYNKLNIRAKTLLPGLGDPIIGIDSTENGKYLLATCSTYLLLVDTEIEGEAGGKNGYQKGMGDKKPVPKRLQLRPEHVAWMGENVSFTPARFNTGDSLEKTIITSTGPYVITWNFRQVKLSRSGKQPEYSIKRYSENVVADNFKYGGDRSIIVALPENVEMVSKRTLQTPTKTLKSRSNIVNSPY